LLAVSAGKHVLVEKPAARRAAELVSVQEAARRTGGVVKVGFITGSTRHSSGRTPFSRQASSAR
jgi:predicted dehydrogenase